MKILRIPLLYFTLLTFGPAPFLNKGSFQLFCLQKVHTFQASLEAVLAQLCDAEQAQKSLTNASGASSDSDPTTFRNQLKVFI